MKVFVINKPKNFELRPNNDTNFIGSQHIILVMVYILML